MTQRAARMGLNSASLSSTTRKDSVSASMTAHQHTSPIAVASSEHILDVVIVGGGLSGLSLARTLHMQAVREANVSPESWKLVEASPALGGRLANDDKEDQIDLGGAWVWPGQTHILNMVRGLGLKVFPQPDDPQSFRIAGGAAQIIDKLTESLPSNNIVTEFAVKKCTLDPQANVVLLESSTGQTISCRRVAFAVPPKLLRRHVTFNPPLSPKKVLAQERSNTWMSGVTKVSLVYEKRFWNAERGMSNMGMFGRPAFQVYDASTDDGDIIALTFFTVATGIEDDEGLAHKCARQLSNAWGRLGHPRHITEQLYRYNRCHVKRWPLEDYISEDKGPVGIKPHPEVDLNLSDVEWDGRLYFAGTESDVGSPGMMEGAVGAAYRVAGELKEGSTAAAC